MTNNNYIHYYPLSKMTLSDDVLDSIPDDIYEKYFDCNYASYRIVHAILSSDCKPLAGDVDAGWSIVKDTIISESKGTYYKGYKVGQWSYETGDMPKFEESYRMIRKYPQVWQWCNHTNCVLKKN